MPNKENASHLLDIIVDKAHVGIFVVDEQMRIHLWNNFMEVHSGKCLNDVRGKNLFEQFPELPRQWLERKIRNVFILKNFSFSSWEQRPYLFKFPHNRPVTGGVDSMRQDCTLLPVKDDTDKVRFVCFTLFDVTDTSIYQVMLQDAMKKLQEVSNRDGLTGLYNRRYVEETLSTEYERNHRYGGKLSVILSDIDFFKKFNDEHGHLAGDEVLTIVSQRLQSGLRKPDTLGRYGGEEFMIVLPETDLAGAYIVAERLRKAVCSTPIKYAGVSLTVSVSLGVTQLHEKHRGYEDLIRDSDQALYESKDAGRNCVTLFKLPAVKTA